MNHKLGKTYVITYKGREIFTLTILYNIYMDLTPISKLEMKILVYALNYVMSPFVMSLPLLYP